VVKYTLALGIIQMASFETEGLKMQKLVSS